MRKVYGKMVPKNLTTEQKALSEGCVSWSSGPPWEGARILQSRYHRWWIMDFGVRPRDKRPKSGVAHCKLSPSQENKNEKIQNQTDAHLFFFIVRGSSSRNFYHQDNQTFYREFLERLRKMLARVRPGISCTWMLTTTTPLVTRQSPSMNFW